MPSGEHAWPGPRGLCESDTLAARLMLRRLANECVCCEVRVSWERCEWRRHADRATAMARRDALLSCDERRWRGLSWQGMSRAPIVDRLTARTTSRHSGPAAGEVMSCQADLMARVVWRSTFFPTTRPPAPDAASWLMLSMARAAVLYTPQPCADASTGWTCSLQAPQPRRPPKVSPRDVSQSSFRATGVRTLKASDEPRGGHARLAAFRPGRWEGNPGAQRHPTGLGSNRRIWTTRHV